MPESLLLTAPGVHEPRAVDLELPGEDRRRVRREQPLRWGRRCRLRLQEEPRPVWFRFSLPGLSADLDLRAASVRNPFQLEELRGFRCPERL
jgi:hypothetical protein